jgi:MFS family permease
MRMPATKSLIETNLISQSARAHRIAVSAFFFMHGLCFSSWASRIPDIQARLGLSESGLGAVLFALPVGFFMALPMSGWLIDKFGSRTVVIPSAVLYSVSLACIGASPDRLLLVISLLTFGLAANLLNISINTQAVIVESLYRKKILAAFHGVWSVAGFAGAAIGTFMIGRAVLPLNHFIFIGITLVFIISASSFYLVRNEERVEVSRAIFVMPDKSLIILGMIAFCSMMVEGAMFDWSGVYFIKVVAADKELAGAGYTSFMIAMASMRFLADGLSNRYGLKSVLQASGVLATVGLLIAVLFPQVMPSLFGFLLIGLGVSSVVPMVYSAAGKSKTMSAGTAITAVSSLGFLGFLIGPPTMGFIAEAFGLRISFFALSVMSIAVVVFSSLMSKSRRRLK